jgi:hypothetical protein
LLIVIYRRTHIQHRKRETAFYALDPSVCVILLLRADGQSCAESQAAAICRYYPAMRVASLRFHMCKATYEQALPHGRGEDLWGWTSFAACADACLRGLESEGWTGHEVFYIVAEDILWAGSIPATTAGSGGRAESLRLLDTSWRGRYEGVREDWWKSNGRRGFWDCTKAERLLEWTHG